jgi:hypothetical protein
MPKSIILTDEDRDLLKKVSNLLEEIVETCNILDDKETMTSIKQSEKDAKAGRVRDYSEFITELKHSGEI